MALALHVHEITGSALAVSALFATTMLPVVLLAPLAGRLADRVESVRLLALSTALQAAVALGLAFTTSLAPLLVLALLLAAGATVSAPAEFALVPAIARPDRLVAANGTVDAARSAGMALGPVLAAMAVAVGGTRLALLAAVGALLLVSGAMTIEVVFATDVLQVGEAGYAVLVAAWMVGMTIGSVGARRVAAPSPRSRR